MRRPVFMTALYCMIEMMEAHYSFSKTASFSLQRWMSATLKMLEKSFGVVVSQTTSDKTTEFVIWKLLKLEDTTWGNLTFITNELMWSITLICFILHVRPSRVFKRSCIPKHSFSSLAWKWDRTWLNKVENTFDQSLVGVFKVEIMRVKFLTNEIRPVH